MLLDADDDFDWLAFYRSQYADVITEEKINRFKGSYKGSPEERRDLLTAYEKFKGKMAPIYEVVVLSSVLEDEERFRGILDEAIEQGEVQGYDAYVNETEESRQRRVKNALNEAKMAEREMEKVKAKENKKKGRPNGEGDLLAMIQQNQRNRGDSFLANLEAKYAGEPKAKGKKRGVPAGEPSEEAFEATKRRAKGAGRR